MFACSLPGMPWCDGDHTHRMRWGVESITCNNATQSMELGIGPLRPHQPLCCHLYASPCTASRTYLESPKITVRWVTFGTAAIAALSSALLLVWRSSSSRRVAIPSCLGRSSHAPPHIHFFHSVWLTHRRPPLLGGRCGPQISAIEALPASRLCFLASVNVSCIMLGIILSPIDMLFGNNAYS